MDKTSLGDRMKFYEGRFTNEVLMPMIPVMARLDGRSFSRFTKGLARPYDERLSNLMQQTTRYLVDATGARAGYTQSDEISLVWLQNSPDSDIFFSGKLTKMVSVLASMCSVYFNKHLSELLPEKSDQSPVFDCRVWNVPLEYEACNCLIWREMDATRNSVSMAARSFYSHKELHGKNSSQMQEMMFQKGQNWNDYPSFFKRGTYVFRKPVVLKREDGEEYTRNRVEVCYGFPPLKTLANREDVIFRGAEPELKEETDE
jgi:tRNA(His) 5'-end guanylyltransferase